ncbi:hypothetical protein DFJ73DRAFT_841399 [Zopfochytrium polystomum]|nr:hypothetical protein DFJ73DRAFT_841399 [Zopfochytrium polystomum]
MLCPLLSLNIVIISGYCGAGYHLRMTRLVDPSREERKNGGSHDGVVLFFSFLLDSDQFLVGDQLFSGQLGNERE